MSLRDANPDAYDAWCLAFDFDDDPKPRDLARAAKAFLKQCRGEIGRLQAAAAACQAEHTRLLRQTTPGVTQVAVIRRSIELIETALALAGAPVRPTPPE